MFQKINSARQGSGSENGLKNLVSSYELKFVQFSSMRREMKENKNLFLFSYMNPA